LELLPRRLIPALELERLPCIIHHNSQAKPHCEGLYLPLKLTKLLLREKNRAPNGAIISFLTILTDLSRDLAPQLGDMNPKGILPRQTTHTLIPDSLQTTSIPLS